MSKSKVVNSEYEFASVEIALIDVEEQQVRQIQVDDDIHELSASITSNTMLQLPGVLAKEDGRYSLCWGRRRLEAYKSQRKTHIPCRILRGDIAGIKALALIENVQRRPMTMTEECNAVSLLYREENLSIDQITQRLSRSRSWVLLRLAFPNFSEDVRAAVSEKGMALSHAEIIQNEPDPTIRAYLINESIHNKASLRDITALAKASQDAAPNEEAISAGVAAARAQPTYREPHTECAACGVSRPITQTRVIRVCITDCSDPALSSPSPAPKPTDPGQDTLPFAPPPPDVVIDHISNQEE